MNTGETTPKRRRTMYDFLVSSPISTSILPSKSQDRLDLPRDLHNNSNEATSLQSGLPTSPSNGILVESPNSNGDLQFGPSENNSRFSIDNIHKLISKELHEELQRSSVAVVEIFHKFKGNSKEGQGILLMKNKAFQELVKGVKKENEGINIRLDSNEKLAEADKRRYNLKIKELKEEHKKEIEDIKKEIEDIKKECEEKIEDIKKDYEQKIKELKLELTTMIHRRDT